MVATTLVREVFPMNRLLWIVAFVVVFQLGIGAGLLAGQFFLREDPKQACIRSLEMSGPRLQWLQ